MRFKVFITTIAIISISLLVWHFTQDVQWVIAIITLLVGVGAILQSYIINWLWHPELHLSISLKPADCDCHKIPVMNCTDPEHGMAYYFNIRIKNEGNAAAEDVEVAILEVCKEKNGSYERIDFPPMNIFWRHSDVFHGEKIIIKDRIAPLIDTHFTLGQMLHPVAYAITYKVEKPKNVLFELLPIVKLNTNTHILETGTYKITIALAAKHIPTLKRTYRLWFNGNWDNNPNIMLQQNVSINPMESVAEKEVSCIKIPFGKYNKIILQRDYKDKKD